jgi:hypothetical protein
MTVTDCSTECSSRVPFMFLILYLVLTYGFSVNVMFLSPVALRNLWISLPVGVQPLSSTNFPICYSYPNSLR